jgi:hypothetical protein
MWGGGGSFRVSEIFRLGNRGSGISFYEVFMGHTLIDLILRCFCKIYYAHWTSFVMEVLAFSIVFTALHIRPN